MLASASFALKVEKDLPFPKDLELLPYIYFDFYVYDQQLLENYFSYFIFLFCPARPRYQFHVDISKLCLRT